ncbi:MAG: LacI family DNA-binding transcriptional regulator, partial [Anaerolineales bacterium]|nr:LacI family DNA-binding transcriptional regulator [Anaerolineales bacterium]
GKRIPEDISIIGFDDIQFAAMSSPALSTVHVDKYALGQQAFLRTLQLLQEPNHTLPAVEFDISLKLRETTLPRIS